jgi:hypothetical protein
LELARELKLLHLGTVSLDGTHIKASAAKDQNVTYERAQQLRTQLRLDVDQLLAQAEQADTQDKDPQKLPQEIARREMLLAKMDAACAQLAARAQARAAQEKAEYEAKLAARAERQGPQGRPPVEPRSTPAPEDPINLTDPDARLMRKSKSEGYTQSYNAQAVVDADGSQLIVGQRVSPSPGDQVELEPDVQSIPSSLGQPTAVLADCGYVNRAAFARLTQSRPKLDLYVSVQSEDAHAERRYDYRPADKIKQPKKIIDPALMAMAQKLGTPAGRKKYRRRACTVEPVFGIIKAAMGFRQFLLRGLRKVTGEWNLICLAYNFRRLHRLQRAA